MQHPVKLKIKSMEEYTEAKIYKSKPELKHSNANAISIHLQKYLNQLPVVPSLR